MIAKLILVDGISGSGKSTTAQWLYLQLRRKGFPATWYYEYEVPHPIYHAGEVQQALMMGDADPHRIHEKALVNWKTLAQRIGDRDEIIILESTLLQTGVGSQFLMNWPSTAILDHIHRVEEILSPLHPAFVYFYQDDVERALNAICQRRGAGFDAYLLEKIQNTPYGRKHSIHDFSGVIDLYRAFRQLTDAIVVQLRFQKISLETSHGDWDDVLHRLAAFLSLGQIESPFQPCRNWDDYTGCYRLTGADQEWCLAADERGLYVNNAFGMRLVHKTDNVFYLEGACLELAFESDGEGTMARVVCRGNLLDEPLVGTVWEKV